MDGDGDSVDDQAHGVVGLARQMEAVGVREGARFRPHPCHETIALCLERESASEARGEGRGLLGSFSAVGLDPTRSGEGEPEKARENDEGAAEVRRTEEHDATLPASALGGHARRELKGEVVTRGPHMAGDGFDRFCDGVAGGVGHEEAHVEVAGWLALALHALASQP